MTKQEINEKRRKYKKGEQFKNAGDVINWLNSNKSIYIKHKFTHFGWALGFQLNVYQAIKREQK